MSFELDVLKQILSEQKRTNELLEKIIEQKVKNDEQNPIGRNKQRKESSSRDSK